MLRASLSVSFALNFGLVCEKFEAVHLVVTKKRSNLYPKLINKFGEFGKLYKRMSSGDELFIMDIES